MNAAEMLRRALKGTQGHALEDEWVARREAESGSPNRTADHGRPHPPDDGRSYKPPAP